MPPSRVRLAASWLASRPASISILRPAMSSRSASALVVSAPASSNAALLCSIIASIVWPCASSPARAMSTDSAALAIDPSTAASICCRRLVHPLGGRAGAAFDPGDMGAEPLRGAARDLVGLAALGGQRGELAFERAGLLVRGEARLLHRLGGGARLRLGLGQIAHQHADIDPRRFGGHDRAPAPCGRARRSRGRALR